MKLGRESKKSLGAFYTEPAVVDFLAAWVTRKPCQSVMDPACGDGRFLEALARRGVTRLVGCDLDPGALEATRLRLAETPSHLQLLAGDFFARLAANAGEVDAVVGNPPFVRYQRFDHSSRALALASALKVGVRLQRLTSTWAPFLLHAMQFLRPGGDLAMVVPAEITQTHYGLPTLRALSERFGEVRVVAFEQNIFREAQTETYLLLARDYGGRCGAVRLVPLRSAAELQMLALSGESEGAGDVALDFGAQEARFIEAFLSQAERDAWAWVKGHNGVARLGDLGTISNGYVTGDNAFFHRARAEAREQRLPESWLLPSARSARSLRGLTLDAPDILALERDGKAHHLVVPEDDLFVDREALRRFVLQGEAEGVHTRFKCRSREPWWRVPGLMRADLLISYMAGERPRAAVNRVGALHSNTLHGMMLRPGVDGAALVLAFHSSLALLSLEIEGRSYGGGILKLEPTEMARARVPWPLPDHRGLGGIIAEVDQALRSEDYAGAVKMVDEDLLVRQLGIPRDVVSLLASGRRRLAERRLKRARPVA